MLEWLKPHGKLVELRAYGNFTGSAGVTWSRLVTVQSVTSRHMPKIVAGKNASDIALTIDAIETLLSTDIDTFVLIASDSDFAPLAQRITAQGREVLGFGQQSAPKAFRDSCTTFKEFRYLNVHPSLPLPPALWSLQPGDAEALVMDVLQEALSKQEEVSLSELSQLLRQRHTAFDPRVFRRRSLSELLCELPKVAVTEREGVRYASIANSLD